MIPKACKRLAEVDFPIAEVSRHAAREKSIRHGHPSTLHLWWARRPLASSRAVLMALLLPDPCDPYCPAAFGKEARRILLGMHGRPGGWTGAIRSDEGLRRVLLKFIADFADWDHAANRIWLHTGRALVRAAHGEGPPLVVDPFAGGGSIPLEALRLGCEAFASDLNPVACLILKVMLEDIPRHGSGLADEPAQGRRRDQAGGGTGVGRSLPRGPGREHAHRLPVGAHGALRSPELRGGDPAAALAVACEEGGLQEGARRADQGQGPSGASVSDRASGQGAAACRVGGVRAGNRQGRVRRHGHAGEGRLPVLRRGPAAGTGAGAALRAARRRGRDLRRQREAHRRRAHDRGGDAEGERAGPALSAADGCRLRGGARGAGAAGRDSRRMGAGREAGALPGAGRAAAAGRNVGLSRTALRDAAMGRSVHGAAEGGAGGAGKSFARVGITRT